MDLGESLTETAARETTEETGVTVEITGLVGNFPAPRHMLQYARNSRWCKRRARRAVSRAEHRIQRGALGGPVAARPLDHGSPDENAHRLIPRLTTGFTRRVLSFPATSGLRRELRRYSCSSPEYGGFLRAACRT